jgi:CRISPR-associated protein (TIGR02584 family)
MKLAPGSFRECVLLAVTGFSSQIVTETLYALCVKRTPPFVPTRIHLLTTAEGARHAELTLLHPHQGKFKHFCEDYGFSGKIHFDLDCIETIRDAHGAPLSDIRTPEENAAAANTITACVQRLTADPDSALHVSLAGGRKTMGFYLGYALSLFGRQQDELSHVLVSQPFESNHGFYYPPTTPEVLFTADNKPISTADANIQLAAIPFVRLRHGLPDNLLTGGASFDQAVEAAQQSLQPPELVIDLRQQLVTCGNKTVTLSPQLLAFYAWLAKLRKERGDDGFTRFSEADPNSFLSAYKLLVGEMAHDFETAVTLMKDGMPVEFFEEKKSRVNAVLKRVLGVSAQPYLIQSRGKRPVTRFGLTLTPVAIHFN